MGYFIFGLIVVAIFHRPIWALLTTVLFEPRVNSVLTLVVNGVLILYGDKVVSDRLFSVLRVLWILSAFDCIHDIVVADSYYEGNNDFFYKLKSILSLLTLGIVRILYLVAKPLLRNSEIKHVHDALTRGEQLSFHCPRYRWPHSGDIKAREYYYQKEINRLLRTGLVVSNEKTLNTEVALRKKRVAQLYPQKLTGIILEAFAGDKELIARRDEAEKKLSRMPGPAFLGVEAFEQLPNTIISVMKDKPPYSVSDMASFKELNVGSMFIIQALEPLVKDGIFEDLDLNDNDPLDTHIYHYTKSTSAMKSLDAGSDPRFADPDLCD